MLIKGIKIENLRCFEKVDLDLTRPEGKLAGFTVLAGRNGSGKSTLLKVMALVATGHELAQALEPGLATWIREYPGNRATLMIETNGPPLQEFLLSIHDGEFGVRLALRAEHLVDARNFLRKNGITDAQNKVEFEKIFEVLPVLAANNRRQIVLIAYGPYRRLTGMGSETQRLLDGPIEIARVASLFREDVSLIESVSWLRDIYLRRLEGNIAQAELEKTVLGLLNDGLLPDGAIVERIDSDGLWINQNGVAQNLRELSDGYRAVAALVLDMVRHLHNAYGELKVEKGRKGSGLRILSEAVVLIDEIEMHLHVSWQRRIGFWLKEHFPNIQFIVTTHSPFVCQAADPGGLIRLPAPGENRKVERVSDELYYTVVNGSLDEAVLSELFGLETPYTPEAEELRNEVAGLEAKLIVGRGTAKDRKTLESLRKKLPHSMSSDVEIAVRSLDKT